MPECVDQRYDMQREWRLNGSVEIQEKAAMPSKMERMRVTGRWARAPCTGLACGEIV